MSVSFKLHLPPMPADPDEGYQHKPVEYVEIGGMGIGRDVVSRPATDEDKAKHAEAYAAFKKSLKEKKP